LAVTRGVGVFAPSLRYGDPDEARRDAALLEELGYSALWVPDAGDPPYEALERLLAATSTASVATGVLNIWRHPASELSAWLASAPAEQRDRLVLGLGVSHAPMVGEHWARPLVAMGSYLDELDRAGLGAERRVLAALGPKMLSVAARRSAGAMSYLVSPEHTIAARRALGTATLVVEQGVVLEEDPERARQIARDSLVHYRQLPNYRNSWRRLGFSEAELDGLSDRFIDAIFAWGDVETIEERVEAHREAGADQVCLQVLGDQAAGWQALAPR
jgi:probable F420-dependent oxidoreductase